MTRAAPARLQEIPNRLPARVRGLTCPSCGGALDVATGLRVVLCPYCETRLLVLSEIGIRRLAVEPQIETAKAREIVQRWLGSGWNKNPRLRREARVGEAFLSFLPFFRVEADCLGFGLGTEERRRTVGSGKRRRTETYEVDVERAVQRSFDRTYPALNVAEWGLQWIDLHGDILVPFDSSKLARQGMVFPPTLSESVVKKSALEQFRKEAEPSTGLKRVRFRFLESLRERLTVIYYPLWVVRYRFDDRSYQVLIDAQDGSLGFGKAPGNDLYKPFWLVSARVSIEERMAGGGAFSGLMSFFLGDRSDSRAPAGEGIFVLPAFPAPLAAVTELTRRYTEAVPELGERLGERLLGGCYDEADAHKLGHFVLIASEVDKPDTLQNLHYDIEFGDSRLLGVPFIRKGETLTDALFGIRI